MVQRLTTFQRLPLAGSAFTPSLFLVLPLRILVIAVDLLYLVFSVKQVAMATPPFLRMQLHLFTMVLSNLDNIQSLGSSILSHFSLYSAFEENPNTVIYDILRNQMSLEEMIYAMATYEASSVEPRNTARAEDLLQRWFNFMGPEARWFYRLYPGKLKPSVAGAISRKHTTIQYFGHDFVKETLPLISEELGLERPDYIHVTANEVLRIHRALYRFQINCHLFFHDDKDFRPDRERRRDLCDTMHGDFFGPFSPWLNEQLVCIHDYLERVLSRGKILPSASLPSYLRCY